MKKTYFYLLLYFTLFGSLQAFSQDNQIWKRTAVSTLNAATIPGSEPMGFTVSQKTLKQNLSKTSGNVFNKEILTMTFPGLNGEILSFRLQPSGVLSEGLQRKFPQLTTYKGFALEDPEQQIHLSFNGEKLHAMIMKNNQISLLNPVSNDSYLLAAKSSFQRKEFNCLYEETKTRLEVEKEPGVLRAFDDSSVRTYRLAVAATAEYSNYHIENKGLTNATVVEKKLGVLESIVTTMVRVNAVFLNDLGITMELVEDNEAVIFLDPDTDGFTNSSPGAMISEVQQIIDSRIGINNYDVGHVFATGSGGIAQLSSPCTNAKARGVSGLSSPEGDPFDIDIVAHEFGHQFGASHTFNNSCNNNRSSATAVEPGSGSTIMAYAGICPPNVEGQSDGYFHAISIAQIHENVTNGNSSGCAAITANGNTAPIVTDEPNKSIPAGTAFVLTAEATDADGDNLTYCWEQQDNEISQQPPRQNASGGPNFRSVIPSPSPTRFFPRASAILNNNLSPTWEVIPTVARNLDFSVLVRDNSLDGGQSARDDVRIEVVNTGEPFTVTSQAEDETIGGSSIITVTWNVAGTDMAPINVSRVDIFMSIGGDLQNLIPLQTGTANDGEESVVIPGDLTSDNARIVVKAVDNVFFAVNRGTLSLQPADFFLELEGLEYQVCKPDDLQIPAIFNTSQSFSGSVDLQASQVPAGLSVTFDQNGLTTDETPVTINVSGTANLNKGNYTFQITATDGTESISYPFRLTVFDDQFAAVTPVSPAENSVDVLVDTPLEWETLFNAETYTVEISNAADFSSIVETATTTTTNYTPQNLLGSTEYFWRVKPVNRCGEGSFGAASSYTTIPIDCRVFDNNETKTIGNDPTTVSSSISIAEQATINSISVSVDITHTYVEDLIIRLTSPSGNTIVLLSNQCGESDDISVTFSDEGEILTCVSDPAIQGVVMPQQALETFKGEPVNGLWTLTVEDVAAEDGGSLNSFALDICVNGSFAPDSDNDGVFDDDDLCPDTPPNTKVDVTGCPVFSLANDNFSIQTIGVSCRNNNDGSVIIEADQTFNYTATLTGAGGEQISGFTSGTTFDNLSPGSYSLCITLQEQPDYAQCYEVIIDQPEALSVSQKIDESEKTIELNLQGGELYTIRLNGLTTQTRDSELTLSLKEGLNSLKVSTDKSCQGVIEKTFIIGTQLSVFPNPATDLITLSGKELSNATGFSVYDLNGRLVLTGKPVITTSNTWKIDLSSIPSGMYIGSLNGIESEKTFKIVKK
ncbi:reprolysin-like metallopeptidase [Robertkochia aurantiaca]|uniref:reprolysin-like metallopeptidase n=1 Tax=Robertkochia aurantiaca TaxID=2873700 RepID=UPI0027299704|nr:zinc-dependent metalloprotease family protein [Robertkochia sp. 3YJGBD-33]